MARRVEYQQEEVRVLQETLATATGKSRVFFTPEQRRRLAIVATSEVELKERLTLSRLTEQPHKSLAWTSVADQLSSDARLLFAREYCFDSPLVRVRPMLREYAEPSFIEGRPLLDAVLELSDRVHSDFSYEPATTDVSTPLAHVMRERRGVCQDFAHVMIGCRRSVGLAARYVSDYLETVPPPGQPRLVGSDASHAWVAAFLPGLGAGRGPHERALAQSEPHHRGPRPATSAT